MYVVCIRSVEFFIWIRFWSTKHKICSLRFILRVKERMLRHIWASEHLEKGPSSYILWGQIKDTTIFNLSTSVSVPQNGGISKFQTALTRADFEQITSNRIIQNMPPITSLFQYHALDFVPFFAQAKYKGTILFNF